MKRLLDGRYRWFLGNFLHVSTAEHFHKQSALDHSVFEPKINSDLFPLSACPDRYLHSELRAKHHVVRLDQHDEKLPIQKF